LPISSSFIAYFVALPLCYSRLVAFSGIIRFQNVRYAGVLTRGYFEGEQIMTNPFAEQHRFSLPITPVNETN